MKQVDLIIIGGGPAGLSAAVAAREHGVQDILILERDHALGGILNQCIHNGFGLHMFKEELTGPEYAQRYIDQVEALKIDYLLDTMVVDVNEQKQVRFIGRETGYQVIQAKAIILAMGCRERPRGALNIPGTRPSGVYTAGAAQRYMNIEGYKVGKRVVILGSGDIGLIMARRLTLEGAKVEKVLELMPYSGGLTRNIVQCLEDFSIPLLLSHTVVEVVGKDRVEGVYIAQVDEQFKPIAETRSFVPCDTLLFSVGLIPENELSKMADIEISPITKGPVVDAHMQTNQAGIFSCGNVLHVHDLVDYVSEESQMAGKYAAEYLKTKEKKSVSHPISPGAGVRYTVPSRFEPTEDFVLRFRVERPFKQAKIVVLEDGVAFKEIKRQHMAPGEMETLNMKAEEIKGKKSLQVAVEEC